jgi:serine/threonine-protein kinase
MIANKYRVLRKLGGGGFGRVYLAEHVGIRRFDAIKVLHPAMECDEDVVKRFAREAHNAAQIKHPHVAVIYDYGEYAPGSFFIAMEYVEGNTLSQEVEARGRLPIDEALTIGTQIADALDAAHTGSIPVVHRDLKPDNIIIGRDRHDAPRIKVVDFGIAKTTEATASRVSQSGIVQGTPSYMSLEQLSGGAVDGRSDLFALGCILFEMIAGECPLKAQTLLTALRERMEDPIPRLRERLGDVPPTVDGLIARAMGRSAHERFATAADMRAALTAAQFRVRDAGQRAAPAQVDRAGETRRRLTDAIPLRWMREAARALMSAAVLSRRL